MINAYVIKRFTSDDFDAAKTLMKDCFGMEVDSSYLKWKYFDNPSGKVIGFLAIHKETNEAAGFYGVIPELYSVNGKQVIIYQSCDTMTHSNHRRKGLYKALKSRCIGVLSESNALFIIGFSGNINSQNNLKTGWKHLFNMKYYFIPNYPRLSSKRGEKIDIIIDYSTIEHLTLTSNNEGEVHSIKSAEIYKWRLSNPRKNYTTLALHDNQMYHSYLTYNIEDKKLYLLDFKFKSEQTGKKLIGALRQKVKQSKLMGIVAYVQEKSSFAKELKSLGFISNPLSVGPLSKKGPFFFYSTRENMEKLSNPALWLVNSFDHDAM